MKKILREKIFILILMASTLPVSAGIDISSGTYSDNYSTDTWKTDCYSYTSTGVARNSGGYMVLQLSSGTAGTLTYKFTRNNASLPVVVQFDVRDFSLGQFRFAASQDTNFTYQTLANWLGSTAPNAWLTVKTEVAAGISTFYISFQQPTSGAYLDNLTMSTDLSSYYTYDMPTEGFTLVESFNTGNWQEYNYQISGTAVRSTANSMSFREPGDEISYRFQTASEYVIDSMSLSCNAQCSPNTLNVTIKALEGFIVYSQDFTTDGTINLSTATDISSLVDKDGFEIVFTADSGAVSVDDVNVIAEFKEGTYLSDGDLNRDGVVDWADLYLFSQDWLSGGSTNTDFVDYSVIAANWFNGYNWAGYVNTITDLQNLSGVDEGDLVWVLNQKGFFFYTSTITDKIDNIFFVGSNVETGGKWVRLNASDEPVNVRWFGAVGDGLTDDSAAIQSAANFAKSNNLSLYLPSGTYHCDLPLDFTKWTGLKLEGAGSGATQLIGNSISNVCFDFSGSSYGTISDISFAWTNVKPKVTVLLARGDAGYGSDLVFNDCFFASGSVAGVYSFTAEVFTFNNCRFECDGGAGFYNTGSDTDSVSSPFGYAFSTAISCTQWTFINSYFKVINGGTGIILNGLANSQADFSAHSCWFDVSGDNSCASYIYGNSCNINFFSSDCYISGGASTAFAKLDDGMAGFWMNGSVRGGLAITNSQRGMSINSSHIMTDANTCFNSIQTSNIFQTPQTFTTISNTAIGSVFNISSKNNITAADSAVMYSLSTPDGGKQQNIIFNKTITSDPAYAFNQKEGMYFVSFGNEWCILAVTKNPDNDKWNAAVSLQSLDNTHIVIGDHTTYQDIHINNPDGGRLIIRCL